MIDYLLVFASQAAALDAFPLPEGEGSLPASWDSEGRTIMPARIILAPATFNEGGELLTPEVNPGGYWIAVRTPNRDPELDASPACMIATSTALAKLGQPFVYFHNFAPGTIIGQVSPVFAGDAYPIPVGETVDALEPLMVI